MPTKSLGNPFDEDTSLIHGEACRCKTCSHQHVHSDHHEQTKAMEQIADSVDESALKGHVSEPVADSEEIIDRAIESAIVRGIFNHDEPSRRRFLRSVGGASFAAALGSVLPMDKIKAAVKEGGGPLEKKKLKVGFVPITCATPIIMAHPMGFYQKHGLDVEVIKTAGWAVARDKSLNGEYDASHMLTPMPLAMSMGAGSTAEPYIMPAVENINGSAAARNGSQFTRG